MSYTISVSIEANSEAVFNAITQSVQEWWGYTNSAVSKLDDEFTASFDKTCWKFKISEFEPNSKIVWQCIHAKHIHSGYDGIEKEWIGTKVEWYLEEKSQNETILNFIHNGLVPKLNCYEICWPAWERFVTQSLKSFVESGKGMPHLS
ncbi:SRPBCC family protein [Aquimarina sp. M1]